jgi:hypothetical protein
VIISIPSEKRKLIGAQAPSFAQKYSPGASNKKSSLRLMPENEALNGRRSIFKFFSNSILCNFKPDTPKWAIRRDQAGNIDSFGQRWRW